VKKSVSTCSTCNFFDVGRDQSEKHFELGKVEYPILSTINIGVAGSSSPSPDDQGNDTNYTRFGRMLGRIKVVYLWIENIGST
jgi:hypothetical protein